MLFSVEDRYMMYYDLLLDVDLSGCRKQLQIKKGEVDSRTIRIELCRGTFPVVLDPKRHWAMIKGIKADKTVLVNPGTITNEGKIEYALGSQDAAAVGNSWYEVMVIDTDGDNPRVLYSAQWKIEVGEELVEDGKITSTNEYGALTAAIKKIDDSIHVLARFSEGKKELSTSNGATAYEEVLNVKNNPGLQVLITDTNAKNLNAGYYTEKDGKKTLIASTEEVPYLIPYDSSDDSVGFWINGSGTIEITYAIVQRMTIDEYARYMFKEVSTKAEKLIEDGFMLEIEQGGEVVRINLKDYIRKINGKIDEQIQEMEKTKDSAINRIEKTANDAITTVENTKEEAVSNVDNAKNVAMSLFYFEEQDINTTNATPQYKVKAPLLKIKVSSSNIKINYYNKYYYLIDSQTFAGSIDEIIDLRQHADVEYISILTGTPSTAKIIWLGTAIAELYRIEQEDHSLIAEANAKVEINKQYLEQAEEQAQIAINAATVASENADKAKASEDNAAQSEANSSTNATNASYASKNANISAQKAQSNLNDIVDKVEEFDQKRIDSIAEIKTATSNAKQELNDNADSLREAIVNAADTKKEEINQKGLEVLQSIPEEFSKVVSSTLIKPTESGTEMMLTDSSDMNIQELHLFGRTEQKTTKGIQLLDLSSMKSGTGDGLTYTNRGDGSVQVSGTATSQVGNIWFKGKYDTNSEKLTTLLTLEAGKKYYIKDCILFEGVTNINTQTEVIEVSAEEYPEGRRITGIRNPRQVVGKTYNEVIYPLIAESSTAVEWEEYTGGQPSPSPDYLQEMSCVKNPTVSAAGKNLLPNNAKNKTIRNLIYTVNEDKSISVKGTYKVGKDVTESDIYLFGTFNDEGQYVYIPKGRYSINTISVPRGIYIAREKTKGPIITTENIIKTLSEQDCYFYSWIFRITKDGTYNSTIYPQLEKGNMSTEYEEYKEIQSTQLTCELNGIDDVKDELIVRADGTGQLIQRIYRIKDYIFPLSSAGKDDTAQKTVLYYSRIVGAPIALATNFEQERVMCNKLRWAQHNIWGNAVNDKPYLIEIYSTSESLPPQMVIRVPKDIDVEEFVDSGLDIQYKIKEPIVTDLSAEEVQKILNLRTNKPNTTIWNDQNAEMQVTYVADTKSYIDNKFKELSNAIVASASEAE